jgi:hypothetical protein
MLKSITNIPRKQSMKKLNRRGSEGGPGQGDPSREESRDQKLLREARESGEWFAIGSLGHFFGEAESLTSDENEKARQAKKQVDVISKLIEVDGLSELMEGGEMPTSDQLADLLTTITGDYDPRKGSDHELMDRVEPVLAAIFNISNLRAGGSSLGNFASAMFHTKNDETPEKQVVYKAWIDKVRTSQQPEEFTKALAYINKSRASRPKPLAGF